MEAMMATNLTEMVIRKVVRKGDPYPPKAMRAKQLHRFVRRVMKQRLREWLVGRVSSG